MKTPNTEVAGLLRPRRRRRRPHAETQTDRSLNPPLSHRHQKHQSQPGLGSARGARYKCLFFFGFTRTEGVLRSLHSVGVACPDADTAPLVGVVACVAERVLHTFKYQVQVAREGRRFHGGFIPDYSTPSFGLNDHQSGALRAGF